MTNRISFDQTGGNSNFASNETTTIITESSASRTYGVPMYIVHETLSSGATKGDGPIRIKNGIKLDDVTHQTGPFSYTVQDNGWMVGVGNFSFGWTDGMLTTSYTASRDGFADWDTQYVSVTNQYQINRQHLSAAFAVSLCPALYEALGPRLIWAF